ncbi:MAG: EAL domain-containing protein [Sulfuricella denitrificans]|nr:EAL domain-containing protein [Sulfuricella denitrificans]
MNSLPTNSDLKTQTALTSHTPFVMDTCETQEIFLAHQPIMDTNQNTVAYELLFRSGNFGVSGVTDDMAASAAVILNTFSHFGAEKVIGQHLGFININTELLMSDMLELLPHDQIVLELLESVAPSSDVIQRCYELRDMGFRLALDDFVYSPAFEPLLDLVDYVKIDLLATSLERLPAVIDRLRHRPLKLIAEKLESVEQFKLCSSLGFTLFQGYYFARPAIISGKKADPARMVLLRLLGQILGDDENHEIEKTFKLQPGLSFNLLRLVNSVAMGLRNPVSSLNQALVVLGRRQLQRWIQLLIYTVGNASSQNSPLLKLAAKRGKLMELLAIEQRPGRSDYHERAFMVGMLSLLDVLFEIPMQDILSQLSLNDEVREALLDNIGPLGQLLSLSKALELADFEVATIIMVQAGIPPARLTEANLQAFCWVGDLEREND